MSGGGALYAASANVDLSRCDFAANMSNNGGGAINTYRSHVTIAVANFSRNVSYGSGGAVFLTSSQGVIQKCRFVGNQSGFWGGGVEVGQINSDMEIRNCEFIANSARNGGAISNILNAHLRVVHCTIVGNLVQFDGPAVFGQQDNTTEIASSIMRNNFSPFPGQIADRQGSLTTVSHSNVEGGWIGDGNIDSDEYFVRDPSDGGDGWGDDPATPFVDEGVNDDFGDLRLQPGSPAINSGDPAFDPEMGESELDGHARVLCGRVDMGAYEFGIGDVNCDQAVDPSDFAAWPFCSLAGATPLLDECVSLDIDNDGDIDLADFAALQRMGWSP